MPQGTPALKHMNQTASLYEGSSMSFLRGRRGRAANPLRDMCATADRMNAAANIFCTDLYQEILQT